MSIFPKDIPGLLHRGGQVILAHTNKAMPLPYIKPNPGIRPHILDTAVPGLRHDWLLWISDVGLVVYAMEDATRHNRIVCVPRLIRVAPFDGYFSPPERAEFGGQPARVVDYIHVPRRDRWTLIEHFDNWFGFQGHDLSGAPYGPPLGLWTEKPLKPNQQIVESDESPTEPD